MRSLWRDAESGLEVVRLTQDDEIEEMVRLFENVAQEQGWQPGEALRRWVPRSVYFGLPSADATAPYAGGLQLVLPESDGRLPCHELWPEVAVSPAGRSAHVAMLAVAPDDRGRPLLFWHLGVEMWRYGVAAGLTTLSLEVTPRVLPLYRRLGWPLQIVGERRRHWGEECYLCTLGIPAVAQALLHKAEHSPYYRQIVAQAFRVTLAVPEAGPTPGAHQGAEVERLAA